MENELATTIRGPPRQIRLGANPVGCESGWSKSGRFYLLCRSGRGRFSLCLPSPSTPPHTHPQHGIIIAPRPSLNPRASTRPSRRARAHAAPKPQVLHFAGSSFFSRRRLCSVAPAARQPQPPLPSRGELTPASRCLTRRYAWFPTRALLPSTCLRPVLRLRHSTRPPVLRLDCLARSCLFPRRRLHLLGNPTPITSPRRSGASSRDFARHCGGSPPRALMPATFALSPRSMSPPPHPRYSDHPSYLPPPCVVCVLVSPVANCTCSASLPLVFPGEPTPAPGCFTRLRLLPSLIHRSVSPPRSTSVLDTPARLLWG